MAQNSPIKTPEGQYYNGDKGVKSQAKKAKKIIRKDALYNDSSIARAKMMRGM